MKRVKWILFAAVIAMLVGCVTRSGGGDAAGLGQLATEAAAMGKADLQAMVAKYKGLIAEKLDVAAVLKSKLKEIPLADMMGEKATALKNELSTTTSLISQLKGQLGVYTDALKAVKQ